jgi:hypothetical protein
MFETISSLQKLRVTQVKLVIVVMLMMSKKDHLKIDPKLCEIIGGPRTLTAFQVNGFVEG